MLSPDFQTIVQYYPSELGWVQYDDFLRQLVVGQGCRRICEIGGGANPALPIEFVREHGLDYLIVDISESELAKAPKGYRTRVLDMARPIEPVSENCDLVISKMLAEHVADARQFHLNVHGMLRPGGLAFHFFPTLYTPPFVLNCLMPERLAYTLLNQLQPGRESSGRNAKFPAYYRWCRGPMKGQWARFGSLGYQVRSYWGFYGHEPYYRKIPPLLACHRALCRWLLRHPVQIGRAHV